MVFDGGILKHQCFSSLSTQSSGNYKVRHEYLASDTSALDQWANYSLLNDYAPSLHSFTLLGGDTILTDPNLTLIADNDFTENLRFVNGAVVYLERSPYFQLSGNSFTNNSNLEVARLATSLSEFV